jgi:6-phosphogluconate dehydrogenase
MIISNSLNHLFQQAQRDYFGAHTYELLASPGNFVHTNWTGHGGNVSASTYQA